ncbi:MAG: phosphate acyltransferase PlsX [Neomegalonema sp.]|nr:phosphate acyltransferase PlsX [Neomegalonema sp.]
MTIAIDAMSGDCGPAPVVSGLNLACRSLSHARFVLFGDEAELTPLLNRYKRLAGRWRIVHCPGTVTMEMHPTRALRRGRDSSMWQALDALARGEADAAVSAGNTGALMTMATVRLRPAHGIERPAIAALWPSLSPAGGNVVLDLGADLSADADRLVSYAIMGAEYARISLDLPRPRIALLNVGREEIKGRPEIRDAGTRLAALAADPALGFEFVGNVEGNQIGEDFADVIVTDGFTGNIALKTAEGTARLVAQFLREAFRFSWASRIGSLFAYTSLMRLRRRIDPRRVNGGVFLGLNGAVVKSHGGADAVGMAAAIKLATRLARGDVTGKIVKQVARRGSGGDD